MSKQFKAPPGAHIARIAAVDRAREREAAGSTSTDADTEAEPEQEPVETAPEPEPEPEPEPLPDVKDLCCPITQELLRDPVRIVGSECTKGFERAEIERWFTVKHTDPLTNEELSAERRRLEPAPDIANDVLRYRIAHGLSLVELPPV